MQDNNRVLSELTFFTNDDMMEIDDPQVPQVLCAIESLDGIQRDTVTIRLKDGSCMHVGGGRDNQYKCHVTKDSSYFDLVNPKCKGAAEATLIIMMDQEASEYPLVCIVSLKTVITAATSFSTKGILDPSLKWDDSLDYQPL